MHKLSDDLCVRQAIGGAMVYSPVDPDEQSEARIPGTSFLVLSNDEICRLVAWWLCQNGHTPGGDLIGFTVGLACDGMISQETATVLLRALMARNASEVAEKTLAGWVMEGDDG